MKQYTFFDRDYFNNCGEFSITGEHYRILLQKCFEFGTYLSVVVYNQTSPLILELEKWRVDDILFSNMPLTQSHYRRLYYANMYVYGLLSQNMISMFEERCLPGQCDFEDLVFLRKDGSVFFESIFHEGECSIYPKDDEDVSEILSFKHWIPINNNTPEILASECDLSIPSYSEITSDALYVLLRKIQQSLTDSPNSRSLEELIEVIQSYRPVNIKNTPIAFSSFLSFLPPWFIGFKFYVLKKCNALTSTKLIEALLDAGFSGNAGFEKFFELLDEYIAICLQKENKTD